MKRHINYYKPAGSLTLKNYQFYSIKQGNKEYFVPFCNKVEKGTKLYKTTIKVKLKTHYFTHLY